ncbi:type II toxin-antitoxin system HicB family antitoxin [Sulfuricurvum sp.]|uniref:type II toxin-antitoxin system HicB family antitoxin n=1 Tax=Sulfuricurvum sp. TaxID=2025608 RepID=UPI0019CBAA50|nr:type II toxin-antitoxin system HicB family antitoxin [Sulfuricurvum sp.]MBD3798858.1 type II toxin-antitoxin system HicB family antitoxin [Campylobacterota bacterium]MBD3805891.1 type II toxin-antitoxin system HicB family antitoxin [Sulfuricurvum sp.]
MKNLEYYINLDYEIVIRKVSSEDGDGWFAYYKDFKGVMGDGENAIEAIESARSAFLAFVEVSLAQGDYIPEPHSHEKSLRINISMPDNLVKKIDSYIEPLHLSRSAFLQKAAMREMGI